MTSNVKMKAVDTLHISAFGPHSIKPGEEFEISETFAGDLEKRGLATRMGAKKESAPSNKMEAAPANKAESAPDTKADEPADAEVSVSAEPVAPKKTGRKSKKG